MSLVCRFTEANAAHVEIAHVPTLAATLVAATNNATLELRRTERSKQN